MVSAGRVLIIPRGEFDIQGTYEMLDLVSYEGSSYLCKKTVTGVYPTDIGGEYWQKFGDTAKVLTSVLPAGETTVVIESTAISPRSIGSIKYDNPDAVMMDCVQMNDRLTLTFKPLSTDMNIKIVII